LFHQTNGDNPKQLKPTKMKTLTELTAEQTKRVNNEILDTQKKLTKELAYSKDLQHAARIVELKSHIAMLNGMIVNGWNAPKL
jgi:hypothetical protein